MKTIKLFSHKIGRIVAMRHLPRLWRSAVQALRFIVRALIFALSAIVFFMESIDRAVITLLPLIKAATLKALFAYRALKGRVPDYAWLKQIASVPYIEAPIIAVAITAITVVTYLGAPGETNAVSFAELAPLPVKTASLMTPEMNIQIGEHYISPVNDHFYYDEGEPNPLVSDSYEPPDIDSLKELFANRRLADISRGSKKSSELSITFDGGERDHAQEILDILKEKGIETTFFLTGRFIRKYPDVVTEILLNGHEVGNHTLNHPHLTNFDKTLRHTTLAKITKEYFLNQLNATANLYKELTGEDMAPYWRAPYGEVNSELTSWALEAGYVHVGWTRDYKNRKTLDTMDWVDKKDAKNYYTASEIKERILKFDDNKPGLNGGIILMHIGTRRRSDKAVSMLSELIDEVRLRGFSFVKVSRIAQNLIDAPSRKNAQRKLASKKSNKPSL